MNAVEIPGENASVRTRAAEIGLASIVALLVSANAATVSASSATRNAVESNRAKPG
jgi:hypothetical protein